MDNNVLPFPLVKQESKDGSRPTYGNAPPNVPDLAFEFKERPAAKSSTSVLKATVCQLCGHPLDGKKNGAGSRSYSRNGGPCDCMCHKGA